MKNGSGSKHYPKSFEEQSAWDENASHPTYQRRVSQNGGIICSFRSREIDNQWIVPYNPYLLWKYRCHINVEVCSSVRACKYLFKYVYKGPDRAMVEVLSGFQQAQNEIQDYQDMRMIGSSEACWRLFSFDMSDRSPPVVALPIHLENLQRMYFANGAEGVAVAQNPPRTQLTAWFEYNIENESSTRSIHLYPDMPQWCTWNKSKKTWVSKKRLNGSIGRIHRIHPSAGDLFYFHMLLHNKNSIGKRSFEEIRTVGCTVHPTFQAACRALGLLQDDAEWSGVLDDAGHTTMCPQMRQLLVALLEFNHPCDAGRLLAKHIPSMGVDYEKLLEELALHAT